MEEASEKVKQEYKLLIKPLKKEKEKTFYLYFEIVMNY